VLKVRVFQIAPPKNLSEDYLYLEVQLLSINHGKEKTKGLKKKVTKKAGRRNVIAP
jgi:hypothetical protein